MDVETETVETIKRGDNEQKKLFLLIPALQLRIMKMMMPCKQHTQ